MNILYKLNSFTENDIWMNLLWVQNNVKKNDAGFNNCETYSLMKNNKKIKAPTVLKFNPTDETGHITGLLGYD